jgi:hypothetical protein
MLTDVLDTEPVAADAHHLTSSLTADVDLTAALETDADAAAEDDDTVFATQLLGALAAMAVRSKRRQADLAAALQRAGLRGSAQNLTTALRHLEEAGYIEDLVPLYDGGVLMSVTSRGIEQLNTGPRWTMLDGPSFRLT